MTNAIDCATKLTAGKAGELVKNGVTHVGRYLDHNWKGIDKTEADTIKAAGLKIFSIFEKAATQASYFTVVQGKADALEAIGYAKELGQSVGSAIYFTVDYDAQPKDYPAILAYFQAVKANLQGYLLGAYGSYNVLNYLHSKSVARYYFQTVAWSGGKKNSFLHIYQYQCDKQLCGIGVDLDNLEQTDVGAWGAVKAAPDKPKTVVTPKPNPKPAPAKPVAKPVYHTVIKGQTVSKIALIHSTTIAAIDKLNPQIKDLDLIYPGQKIRVK